MDAHTIDILGKKEDGSLELVIVMDKMIDDSPAEQKVLLDKIENYMGYVDSKDFKVDFPNVSKDAVEIRLLMPNSPSEEFVQWLGSIKSWVEENGLKFRVTTSSH